jgi:homospermidine synthase
VISSFSLKVDEKCAILGYYAVSSGNSLPNFWDNLSGPSSRVKILDPEERNTLLFSHHPVVTYKLKE